MTAAAWAISPLAALVKAAAAPVVRDIWRRRKLNKRYNDPTISDQSPLVIKAIEDLEVIVGKNAQLTTSVASLLEDLKSTGLIGLIARDAFYEIHDDGVRVIFEMMFERHSPPLEAEARQKAAGKLYLSIRSLLRDSIRSQVRDDLLYIFDSSPRNRTSSDLSNADKIRSAVAELRPDVVKQLAPAGEAILSFKTPESQKSSGLNQSHFPSWFYLEPDQLKQNVRSISAALTPAYEYVRLDGPSQRSVDCEIDKLYVPARLIEADFSIKGHSLIPSRLDENEFIQSPSYSDRIRTVSQCVVLGDPGGGKSTLAQRVCLDALRLSKDDGISPLAVKLEVRRFIRAEDNASVRTFVDFIASEIARQANLAVPQQELISIIHHLLFFGRMIIIFDGVDEIINAAKRRRIVANAQQLANRFLQNRFIFTCRRSDFLTTPILGVQVFLLQQFNSEEISAYFRSASRYVFERLEEEIVAKEPDFLSQATQHASEFIKNPLLLALIVWIYNVGQRIPDNRVELYKECSELLFRRWDSLKEIDPDLPDAHWLFQLVTEIAHKLYLLNRAVEGDSNTEWLTARALEFFRQVYDGDIENRARAASERFVSHLTGRSWILQEHSAGIFEFTHRTFMEYFFARWLHDEFDGIQVLFDHVAPRIIAGEWTVPTHLAFQLKAAGKLRSAETLAVALLELLDRVRADSEKKRAKTLPEGAVSNVLRFVITSIGYLQPSEVMMVRITKAIAHATNVKEEWFSAIGGIVSSPTEFREAIAEGVYQSLAADIAARKGHRVGFVVDWLYACYLSSRESYRVEFDSSVLRFDDVRLRFGEKFHSQVQGVKGLASLPKMTFDLTGSITSAVSEVGLAMWDASIEPDGRVDWRFIDFALGVVEGAAALKEGRSGSGERSYVRLFAALVPALLKQRNYYIPAAMMVTGAFDFSGLAELEDKIQKCEIETALGFAVALMGCCEFTKRPEIVRTVEIQFVVADVADVFGKGRLPRDVAEKLLLALLQRKDLSNAFRDYVTGWVTGTHSMFNIAVRQWAVPSRGAFVQVTM